MGWRTTLRGVTVLFGGSTGVYDGETWEWNGTAWTQRVVSGPAARSHFPMVYDAARAEVVLFGGSTGDYSDETWSLGSCTAPSLTAQPGAQTVCAGGSASFAVLAAGTGLLNYQWMKGDAPLADEPNRIAGATGATLMILNTTGADRGDYSCTVTNACGGVISNMTTLTINSSDFNGDGDVGTVQDIEAFFACLGGDCCATCGSSDFNADGDIGTDQDIESFFRVLGGGAC
ncbi:MAG TPA: immunoglobulin domain-containing protein [Phycisphaerales bacterium]|nr:immunoglobulin domain-containing protein [Phycisphaerales bacterium]